MSRLQPLMLFKCTFKSYLKFTLVGVMKLVLVFMFCKIVKYLKWKYLNCKIINNPLILVVVITIILPDFHRNSGERSIYELIQL